MSPKIVSKLIFVRDYTFAMIVFVAFAFAWVYVREWREDRKLEQLVEKYSGDGQYVPDDARVCALLEKYVGPVPETCVEDLKALEFEETSP